MTTTVLLFALAGMALILLIMMVLSSGKGLLISQNFGDSEDDGNPGELGDSEEPEDSENPGDLENPENTENSEHPESADEPEISEISENPENSDHPENQEDSGNHENPYSHHNHYTADETDDPDGEPEPRPALRPDMQTETAMVVWKLDERERFLNESHFSTIRNEKYALIFQKADGTEFRLSCSKAAYNKIPYSMTGEVTFRNHKLIRFASEQDTVSDEYSIIAS